jgi:hypothetical protein
MYPFSKKGFEISLLVKLLIGIVSLILIFYLIVSYFEKAELTSAYLDCNTIFSQLRDPPATLNIYSPDYSDFSLMFYKLLEHSCPKYNLQETSPKSLGNYVNSCGTMITKAGDFLPPAKTDGAFCFYCGDVSFDKDYSSQEFFDSINSSLSEEFYDSRVNSIMMASLQAFSPKKEINYGTIIYLKRNDPSTSTYAQNLGAKIVLDILPQLHPFAKNLFAEQTTIQGILFLEKTEEGFKIPKGKDLATELGCVIVNPKKEI